MASESGRTGRVFYSLQGRWTWNRAVRIFSVCALPARAHATLLGAPEPRWLKIPRNERYFDMIILPAEAYTDEWVTFQMPRALIRGRGGVLVAAQIRRHKNLMCWLAAQTTATSKIFFILYFISVLFVLFAMSLTWSRLDLRLPTVSTEGRSSEYHKAGRSRPRRSHYMG